MPPARRPPDAPPFDPTVRVESQRPSALPPDDPRGSSGGRALVIGLLLLSVTLVSAGVGFVLSGGRLPAGSSANGLAATPAAQTAPPPTPPITARPTAARQPTAAPTPPPAPTGGVAATRPEPAASAAAPKPTSPPQPTPTSPPAAKPAGRDPRLAQIESTIREYFAALNAGDYARAHRVCCTEAWRERYPLETWVRNFDGVTDLEMVGEPRYLRVEPDVVVVDTDYTFRSGGRQRDFTLRWTFRPTGGQWQADLAEAFAR